jgi:hypothetical protein
VWPRDLELALGLWLWTSPFVFRVPLGETEAFVQAFACGAAAIAFALASYHPRLRRAHLASLALGIWLAVHGRFGGAGEPAPHEQNEILVGLLIAMLAIVPSRASEPPAPWLRRTRSARQSGSGRLGDSVKPSS